MKEIDGYDYSGTIFDGTITDKQSQNSLPDQTELTDIVIPMENVTSGYYYPGPKPLTGVVYGIAEELVAQANSKDESDFSLRYKHMSFRGHRMPTIDGEHLIIRRLPDRPWTLSECGIKGKIKQYILSPRLNRGGLVIICGKPGHGKSTTCSSLIVERLLRYGGVAATIEDPVEVIMQGRHGKGHCLQREVYGEESFSAAVRDTMRAYPAQTKSIMLIGEVRDSETASLALRAAVDGRLTIITMHAGDIAQAVHRTVSLATKAVGEEQARSLLASGLRLILHQRLIPNRTGKGKATLRVSSMFDTDEVVGVIRNKTNALEQLNNSIAIQEAMMKSGNEIILRKA